jgi:hypothetical protein
MIRAILVAIILVSFPEHTIPCWAVRRAVAQYGEAAVEFWARASGISARISSRRSDASDRPLMF